MVAHDVLSECCFFEWKRFMTNREGPESARLADQKAKARTTNVGTQKKNFANSQRRCPSSFVLPPPAGVINLAIFWKNRSFCTIRIIFKSVAKISVSYIGLIQSQRPEKNNRPPWSVPLPPPHSSPNPKLSKSYFCTKYHGTLSAWYT